MKLEEVVKQIKILQGLQFGTILLVIFFIGGGLILQWYFGGYLKRKGDNLATKEDFKTTLGQIKETTETTKRIEDRIATQSWAAQRQWERKREIYADLLFEFQGSKNVLDLICREQSVIDQKTLGKEFGERNVMGSEKFEEYRSKEMKVVQSHHSRILGLMGHVILFLSPDSQGVLKTYKDNSLKVRCDYEDHFTDVVQNNKE